MHLTHPETIPSPNLVLGKIVFLKPVPGAKDLGDPWLNSCGVQILSPGAMVRPQERMETGTRKPSTTEASISLFSLYTYMLGHFSHVWLCNPMDSSPLGASAHGILQARILEWVAIPFSKGSFQPRDWTWISYVSLAGRFLTTSATWEVESNLSCSFLSSILFFFSVLFAFFKGFH